MHSRKRAFAYGKLQSDTQKCSPAAGRKTLGQDFFEVNPGVDTRLVVRGLSEVASTRRSRTGWRRIPPATPRRPPRLRASGRGPASSFAGSARRSTTPRRWRCKEILEASPNPRRACWRSNAGSVTGRTGSQPTSTRAATVLVNSTTAKTEDLIAQNASAYASQRNLFIGVAVGSDRPGARCSGSSSPGR